MLVAVGVPYLPLCFIIGVTIIAIITITFTVNIVFIIFTIIRFFIKSSLLFLRGEDDHLVLSHSISSSALT